MSLSAKAYQAAWYQANKSRLQARVDPIKKAQQNKAWKQKNPERWQELMERFRSKPENRAKKCEEAKRYRQRHPQRVAAQKTATRHARRAAGGPPISSALTDRILSGRVCYYCGVGVSRHAPQYHTVKTTIDHIVALKHGGTNSKENLVTACFTCNIRKRSMPVARFLDRLSRGVA